MNPMKQLLIALALAGCLAAQTQAPTPYLSTFGAWTFCVNGMADELHIDCSWYTPGTETYSLNIPDSAGGVAIGYRYSVMATLLDGSSKTLSGVVVKNAIQGYTTVPNLVFGGIVKATVIDVEEVYAGVRVRVEGPPVSTLRRR